MKKWLKYDKGTIFKDKTKDGLFVNFIRDYQDEFGRKVIVGCPKCLAECYNNFVNKYMMTDTKNKCEFVLHKKFNAIKSKTTGQPCRNSDLTDEQAIDLIEKHPHGAKLFAFIPQSYYDSKIVVEKVEEPIKEKKKRTRKNTK